MQGCIIFASEKILKCFLDTIINFQTCTEMKKVLFILFNLLTITAMAQDKGRFEVYDLDNFKLHVYYTNDALGDASYIIEGTQELVTM